MKCLNYSLAISRCKPLENKSLSLITYSEMHLPPVYSLNTVPSIQMRAIFFYREVQLCNSHYYGSSLKNYRGIKYLSPPSHTLQYGDIPRRPHNSIPVLPVNIKLNLF